MIALVLMLVLALALRARAAAGGGDRVRACSSPQPRFGVLQLLFGGTDPPLGGPGYLDPMTIIGIFTIAFGITVTYSALLLMRTREAYVAGDGGTAGGARRPA